MLHLSLDTRLPVLLQTEGWPLNLVLWTDDGILVAASDQYRNTEKLKNLENREIIGILEQPSVTMAEQPFVSALYSNLFDPNFKHPFLLVGSESHIQRRAD